MPRKRKTTAGTIGPQDLVLVLAFNSMPGDKQVTVRNLIDEWATLDVALDMKVTPRPGVEVKRKGGRPVGSRNKPKEPEETAH
jgi:hypothetical protein